MDLFVRGMFLVHSTTALWLPLSQIVWNTLLKNLELKSTKLMLIRQVGINVFNGHTLAPGMQQVR